MMPGQHIKVWPAAEVTSRNESAEVFPREVGLSTGDVESMWSAVVKLYESGLHPAIALCLRRQGKVVIERAIGHVRGNAPGDAKAGVVPVQARYDALFNTFSCSKAVTAMLIHLLDERGLLHLDDPVDEYVPGFGRHGKEWVTIRHILTHRAGIPAVPAEHADASLLADSARVVELLCDAKPISVPGRRLAYHALTGGYVLGEVLRRVTGRDIRTFLRDEVLAPLGFSTFNYGVAPERAGEVAVCSYTGAPPIPPLARIASRSLGLGVREAVAMSNDIRFLTSVVPSGNIIGTAEEGSRFYELLLRGGELNGVRVFDRRTVRRAVAEQSYLEVDSFLGLPVRYGMGFMLGGEYFSPFGSPSAHAFGHVGFTTVLTWADPERDISVCLMTSGKPFVTPGQLRWIAVARAIAAACPRDGKGRLHALA
jgi:CubicO group peptidase (beta-lactamase class C family)